MSSDTQNKESTSEAQETAQVKVLFKNSVYCYFCDKTYCVNCV